ncbi:TolC family protein [bacterium]|nr:TolC family protein [bacterium]MDC1221885.1 TolC family protein [Salibacteraceae bacterium]
MHRKFIIYISLIAFSANVSAQDARTFSLEEALAYGVQNNLQLKQAEMDIKISQSKVREFTAIGLPQVNAEASYNNFIDIPTQVAEASAFDPAAPAGLLVPLQFGLPHSLTGGITASQLLFDGSYFVGLKSAKEFMKYSELGAERTESEVKTGISQTYINAIAAEENIEALEENKKNIEQIYLETSKFYEVGFLEKQDADQVRLLKSNIAYQLDFANRQHEAVLNLLKFQMGIPVNETISLTDNIETLIDMGSDNALSLINQPFSPANHIDYQTVMQGERLSELSLSNTRTGYYPQLSAFFTHSQNSFSNDFGDIVDKFYPTTLWGLQLNVPIFSSGMRYMKTQQSKLELEKTRSQKTMLEQSLTMQAINAANSYKSALERYEVLTDDLELAKTIKETTRIKFNEGLASSSELTQAESQYLTTLGNYINTTIELLNAKLNLVTAYGI